MQYFSPSPFKVSWPFVIVAILLHSISFYSFRAILLVHLRYKFHQTFVELKFVTCVYDTLYYAFLGIGAVVQELESDKYSGILLLMIMLNVGYLLFYVSKYLLLVELCYMAIAAMSGTVKVGMIAYGATEFNGLNCRRALKYFAFTYVVEIFGHFMALRFVPMEMMVSNECGRLTCSHYVMVITMFFEIIAWFVFSYVNANLPKPVRPTCKKLSKIGRNLVVFLPFLIVWINFGDGVWRWMLQARLMNCQIFWYNLSVPDMLHVDLIALVLCGLIFIVFTYSNCTVTRPKIMTGIGGAFMTAGFILSSYLYAVLQERDKPRVATNISSMYITASCGANITLDISIVLNPSQPFPAEVYSDADLTDIATSEKTSFDLNIGGRKTCYVQNVTNYVIMPPIVHLPDTINICLREHQTCSTVPFSRTFFYKLLPLAFDITRDAYGRPKVCIASAASTYAPNFHIKTQEVLYPGTPLQVMSHDNFTCKTVSKGRYNVLINYSKPAPWQNIQFSYGGVYLLRIYGNLTEVHEVKEIRKTLDITVWYLMPSIFLVAFGRICIIVTGMYVFNSQSSPNVRTIALGFWWLYISPGIFIFTITGGIGGHIPNRINFNITALLVFVMTIIFLYLAACFTDWNFTCTATTLDVEAGRPRLSPRLRRLEFVRFVKTNTT